MNQQSPQTSHDPEDSSASASPDRDNSGVRIPPPLVYFAAILIGAATDRFIPIRVLPTGLTGWLGGALVLLALILAGLSFREFGKAKATIRPDHPVSALVTTGPFRYSRNPLYLVLSTLQLGIGIWLNSVWVILLLVPVLAWVRWRVIALEERYLIRKFGQVYLDYQAQVRRWL
jgi:protein-S-isoprenylcysteine O-methyltransferase Ste14